MAAVNEERLAEARSRRAEADEKIIGEKIDDGLGTVQVGISGSLRAIQLEQRLLPDLPEDRVAELVVAAIHRAETKAGQLREILLGRDAMRKDA
ncbi:hypothetical protein [Prauserella cavernicola]|uniref:Uncharacterized protein n=1 Tax=Prauserella cavernicola TaxID=2800127 RepID=A0A934V4V3_9PSEU|nr:hypothetical protein [Prauserella cavernicola]MBK1784495.1 hypothetical protein [Prauserella cavernicola]